MNQFYCVVYNASLGIWVAANELARGRKKAGRGRRLKVTSMLLSLPSSLLVQSAIAADCASASLPLAGGATAGVYQCYISAELEDNNNDGKVDGVNKSDSANYKNKNQTFNSDTRFSLSSDVQWLPENNGPTKPLPLKYVSASELYNEGALTIKDQDGNLLTTSPEFNDWNLNSNDSKVQISWVKTDGTTGYADVYDVDTLEITKDINTATNFSEKLISEQPTQPFINLTQATITNGSNLELVSDGKQNAAGFAIDWKPGQVKQSSLFVADGGTIDQAADTSVRVTFGYTDSVSDPATASPVSGSFGPLKELLGGAVNFQGTEYLINSKSGLERYNQALITAVKNNRLTSSDYAGWFRKAFKNGTQQYTYTFDPGKVAYNDYYISPEMAAGIGTRAIFEATGAGVVNLSANVAAIGQMWAHAYNAWAHDGGVVNNLGSVTVANTNTQNALIESGARFFNKGQLIFNTKVTNWADQVTGSGSLYTNDTDGVISVATSKKNSAAEIHANPYHKLSRNVATEVLDGASAINDGRYLIGFEEPAGSVGTATGVHITNSGSFTNQGNMTIGSDGPLKGGSASETLNVDDSYNAASAWVDNSGSRVSILNTGTIDITAGAQNSVALNVGEDLTLANTPEAVFTPQNVSVVNEGTINVEGKNSAGLKAAGAFTADNNDRIINTGTINVSGASSSGIFAASGAEIFNDGDVVVTGNEALDSRAYGIRADNATVTLEGSSNLTVRGSGATGLYARTGGQINVNGGKIDAPADADANDQVVFWVSGQNAEGVSSTISFSNPTTYSLANSNSTLFRIDHGASYEGGNSNLRQVDVNGSGSNGYTIATKGTSFISGGTTVNVNGKNATGINVNSGAGTDGKVRLSSNTRIAVTGDGATVATVDGNTYDPLGNKTGQDGAKLITEAQLSAGSGGQVAENAIGYRIINKGELEQNGAIDFSAASATTGVYIDGGILTNNGAITSNGIGIDVYQTGNNTSVVNNASNIEAVDGTAAIRLNNRAGLEVGGNGTITGRGTADAIRVMSGASLSVNNANIAVDGSGSGIHFLNTAADAAGSTFRLTGSGNISVDGADAAGITLEGQDASGNPVQSNANMDTRGAEKLVIDVNDQGGNGIVTNTSGRVYSGASVNINSSAGQSALVVKGSTPEVIQTGTLKSASSSSSVVDLNQLNTPDSALSFTNSGNILASGGGAAVDAANHSGQITLNNSGAGRIAGGVELGEGNNRVTLRDNSTTDRLTTGDGDNSVTLQDGAKLTGRLEAGNGANTFNLLDKSQTSQLVAGNGGNNVNIYGGTTNGTLTTGSGNDSFTLNGVNAGNAAPAQNAAAFGTIDGGGTDLLTTTNNSWYTLTDSNSIRNFENANVEKNSTFELKNTDLQLTDAGAGTNVVGIDKSSTWFINFDAAQKDYQLSQNIKGEGTIRTNTNGRAFSFANADYTRDNFSGTLALGNGRLTLAGDNTKALTNTMLQLEADGVAILAKGQPVQVSKGLRFDTGTLLVEEDFIGSKVNALQSHMQVTDLDLSGEGTVQLVANGFDNDYNPEQQLADVTRRSLLRQDEGNTMVTIVKATGDLVGRALDIALNLTTPDGKPLPGAEDKQQEIRQEGEQIATGTYGFGNTIGQEMDGEYAAFLLKRIDINAGKTLNLQTSPGDTKNALDLSARLSGSGNILINGYADHLSLSNHYNDYTGTTTVNHGTLILDDSRVLGQEEKHTSALNLLADTQVRFGDTLQYVGQLNGASGSVLALEQGTLNVASGGTADGQITSAESAQLNLNGGTLNVTAANRGYRGTTTIAQPATANIQHVSGLGSGAIALAGTLNVVKAAAGTLANALSGEGQAKIISGSDVNLGGDNSGFSGSFTVDAASTLRASSAQNIGDGAQAESAQMMRLAAEGTPATIRNDGDLWLTSTQSSPWIVNNSVSGTGNLYKQGNGQLTLTQAAAQYSGQTWVNQGALSAGDAAQPVALATSAVNIAQGASFGGYGSIAGSVNNQGTFYAGGLDKTSLNNATSYQVNGSFTNAGEVVLGSSNATGSTLNIGGDYLSQGGALRMNTVLNKGFAETDTDLLTVGGNARNVNGATRIFVQNVGGKGAFTQPDAIKVVDVKGQSDSGTFVLGRPAVIGVYEYRLNKGAGDNNWYLSALDPSVPVDPVDPVDPTDPTDPGDPGDRNANPMIGAFAANQSALGMFNMTLHDRLGQPQYAESLRQEGDFANSIWLRMVGSHQRYNAINGQMGIDGHSTVVQLGHDLIHWSDNQKWRGRVGVMGGVGNQKFSSKSHRTGTRASANIDSAYSVGLYGTLYQNEDDRLGTYVDSWALYNWYNNTASMSGYSDAHYNSRGYNLSVETGHTFAFARDAETQDEWRVIPQAQLTYGHLSSQAASSDSGLNIAKSKSTSLESRLGARLGYVHRLQDNQQVQPFVEANWRHQFHDNTMTFNEQYQYESQKKGNRYELKVGVEAQRNSNLNGWANVSYTAGDDHYREPKAMIGIKYQW